MNTKFLAKSLRIAFLLVISSQILTFGSVRAEDAALPAGPTDGTAAENVTENVTENSAESAVKPAFRTGKELQKAVRGALKHWKKVPSETQAEAAAHEFIQLFHELESDSEIPEKTRKNLLQSVRSKLASLSRIIETETKNNDSESAAAPQSVKVPENKAHEAAQIGGGMMGGGAGAGADAQAQRVQESGEQLVELIQNTIHPDSWESNGGNGRIMYWNQGTNLIIRQTDANHEEIQNLLDQLRRAGS